MSREECAGIKEDNSDRCDLYDTEGWCHWYGDTWLCEKDNKYHGGEDVECITYCTHRTIKGKRINNMMNPLHMERLPRYFEVVFNGEVRNRSWDRSGYRSCGIGVYHDGSMKDYDNNAIMLKDGTMINDCSHCGEDNLPCSGKECEACEDRPMLCKHILSAITQFKNKERLQ
jgi:hypothetical protein